MSKPSERFKKRKKAKVILKDISDNPAEYLIIHYSCESFFNVANCNTPRITSIAIKSLKNAQTQSFSIHKIAEIKHIPINKINQNHDELEKDMLDEFFEFLERNQNQKWIHINMRNVNYGFEAINHRYKVLGGSPININDNLKIDLARLFVDFFGKNYVSHPRFESLYLMNKITMTSFLNGEQEAKAFIKRDYVALHQSTLRKVDNMYDVISLANENDLKTNSNLFQIYGISFSGIYFISKENWIMSIFFWLINLIITTLLGFLILSIFN